VGARELVLLAIVVSILCTVFGFGLKATWDDVLYLARRPGLLLRSLLAVNVLMPIAAVLLVRAFDVRREVEVALVALAISPLPPLLPNRLGKAGGLAAYGISLMATLGLFAIVTVPLTLNVIGAMLDQPIGIAPSAIASKVLTMIIAPLAAGLLVRAWLPAVASRIERPVELVAKSLLPVAVLALLPAVLPAVWTLVGNGTVAAMVVFIAIGLAVGHVLGGPDPDKATVLAIASACRHPAIALSIASTNFPDEHFGATIVLFLIVSLVACAPYIAWQKGRAAAAFQAA
jgi:BASS family bile acid:Na+ symporter